jgi:hypothetical protein
LSIPFSSPPTYKVKLPAHRAGLPGKEGFCLQGGVYGLRSRSTYQ